MWKKIEMTQVPHIKRKNTRMLRSSKDVYTESEEEQVETA